MGFPEKQSTTYLRRSDGWRALPKSTLGRSTVLLVMLLSFVASASAQDTDLDIRIVDGRSIFVPGSPITYLVEVTNLGPADVTSFFVTPTLPPTLENPVIESQAGVYDAMTGLWNGFCLSAGGVVSLRLSGTVAGTVGQTLDVATSVAPDGTNDPNNSNNLATDVNRRPDVFADGFETGDVSRWSSST
ncbi:MAG: hypothetical protein AAGC60_03595 [Acidobacteriota bacterium]